MPDYHQEPFWHGPGGDGDSPAVFSRNGTPFNPNATAFTPAMYDAGYNASHGISGPFGPPDNWPLLERGIAPYTVDSSHEGAQHAFPPPSQIGRRDFNRAPGAPIISNEEQVRQSTAVPHGYPVDPLPRPKALSLGRSTTADHRALRSARDIWPSTPGNISHEAGNPAHQQCKPNASPSSCHATEILPQSAPATMERTQRTQPAQMPTDQAAKERKLVPYKPDGNPYSVKYLTCWYWADGRCKKPEWECAYSHYFTGRLAEQPKQLAPGKPMVAGRNAVRPEPVFVNWRGVRARGQPRPQMVPIPTSNTVTQGQTPQGPASTSTSLPDMLRNVIRHIGRLGDASTASMERDLRASDIDIATMEEVHRQALAGEATVEQLGHIFGTVLERMKQRRSGGWEASNKYRSEMMTAHRVAEEMDLGVQF